LYPVRGLAIAGNADHMLMQIDMITNDLDLNRSMVPPTFRIADMQIRGE
jgi:predicted Zn-dependent protease